MRRYPGLIEGPKGKALFIHIPRTGGQSICRAFGCQDGHIPAHAPHPQNTDRGSLYTFSVVRNPWDHYVSFWAYSHGVMVETSEEWNKQFAAFRNWLRLTETCPPSMTAPVTGITFDPLCQLAFLRRRNAGMVKHILPLQHIAKFGRLVAEFIGIEPIAIPHVGKSDHEFYTKYYDVPTAEIVRHRHTGIIERFGFTFGA